ncbi:hypothetical protein [Niallia nealsonii]|nr:hypothetical protein [Niallia nealsonii]
MDNKPIFYDGTVNIGNGSEEQLEGAKQIEWTDEARKKYWH